MEVALFVLVVVALFVASSIKIVPQQNAWVVERLGRFHGALQPGLNIVIPFIDRIAYKHLLKEVPLDVEPQVCITKDNTQVQIDGVIFYQVTDPKLASYGPANFQMAIVQLAQTSLRSECGKRELDRLLEERSDINRAVISALDEASPNWGVKVLRYEIKDITPPEAGLRSMQTQITAEREKRATILGSEGNRQSAINVAEGAKQAQVLAAEADKAEQILRAEGEAQAIIAELPEIADAVGEAEAEIHRRIEAHRHLMAIKKVVQSIEHQLEKNAPDEARRELGVARRLYGDSDPLDDLRAKIEMRERELRRQQIDKLSKKALRKRRRFEDVITDLESAAELDPSNEMVQQLLVETRAAQQKVAEDRHAREHGPALASIDALIADGEPGKALESLDELTEEVGDFRDARWLRRRLKTCIEQKP